VVDSALPGCCALGIEFVLRHCISRSIFVYCPLTYYCRVYHSMDANVSRFSSTIQHKLSSLSSSCTGYG